MITHTEAQKLREELHTLRNTLRYIEGKRSKQAKEQRTQLEAREKEIDVLLTDAPPRARSPLEIWTGIEGWARRIIKRETELKKSFLELFDSDPHHAFSSWGQDVIVSSHQADYAKRVMQVGESETDITKRVENLLEAFTVSGKQLQEQIISETRSGYLRSTNSMGNLTTLWQMEATAKLYDELFGGWYSGLRVDELVESFQAWQEWQKELEEGEQ
jgi:hypothetical protein